MSTPTTRAVTGQADAAQRAAQAVAELEKQRPELKPWLRPLRVALTALAGEPWLSIVPICASDRAAAAPLLHEAIVPIEPSALRAHVRSVLAAAQLTSERARLDALDVNLLTEAAVAHDDERMAALAAEAQVDAQALAATAQLACIPLLHACARSLGQEPPADWSQSYCWLCGAPPILAEVRGIERTRHLRCGRCGCAWQSHVLLCPFCGERDHNRLGSLVPEGADGQVCWVETCSTCSGYLKARATLRAAAPESLLLEDARSLELDLAASERGYHKPSRASFAVRLRISSVPMAVS